MRRREGVTLGRLPTEDRISHNTYIHRMVRGAVRPLAATAVTPNHLTTVRLAGGLAAAAAFAVGTPAWDYAGAVLFVLALLLDRADGELARLGGKTSAWGHRFDLIADSVSNATAFIGIGIGLRDSVLGWWALPIGAVAGLSIAAVLWMTMQIEARQGARAAELGGGRFDADDAVLVVPLAMALGGGVPLIIAAAAGAPAFAVFFYRTFRRKLRGPGGPPT